MDNLKNIKIGKYYKYYWGFGNDYRGFIYFRAVKNDGQNCAITAEVISDEALPIGEYKTIHPRGHKIHFGDEELQFIYDASDDEIMARLI